MDKEYLLNAINLSRDSMDIGGSPVGSIIVLNDEIIATGLSNGKQLKDATSHAEICAIREASQKIGHRDLKGATIYSSLEPCVMCFAASYWSSISKIVYACSKEKVSKWHYEGLHDLKELDRKNNRHI